MVLMGRICGRESSQLAYANPRAEPGLTPYVPHMASRGVSWPKFSQLAHTNFLN